MDGKARFIMTTTKKCFNIVKSSDELLAKISLDYAEYLGIVKVAGSYGIWNLPCATDLHGDVEVCEEWYIDENGVPFQTVCRSSHCEDCGSSDHCRWLERNYSRSWVVTVKARDYLDAKMALRK